MFDSIRNVNDFLSEHWLDEVFPGRLRDLTRRWKDEAEHGKQTPLRGLASVATPYLTALAELPADDSAADAVTAMHGTLLTALGIEALPAELETAQGDVPVTVPLLARVQGPSGESLHVMQAWPVDALDDLLGDDARLVDPLRVRETSEKIATVDAPARAVQQLFLTEHDPRYLLLIAGSWAVLTDVARWAEGRYLAFDVRTALSRRDDKSTGELASHAGLYSADVLLPRDDGKAELDTFTQDSEKHAVGVSEDLREGLRTSIELIANEVLVQRRVAGLPVEGVDELPRELASQSLRFLYRVLFLLYAEARPELGILPIGAPEYGAGYGLDRLRDLIQVPLTGASRSGHHLHDSLDLLFRLVNEGHGHADPGEDGTHEGLVFEALRADLFDPRRTPHIDNAKLSNAVLQQVLQLLLLSKPSRRKGSQRGYISYAQLGINQLGAVYEGLMSYSGVIAPEEMVELAKNGNADKGSWLVPSNRAGDYDESDLVWREDRLTSAKAPVRHPKGSFVFRLSGRERQRSASFYTPEVLTRTVVKHALAELITDETRAAEILDYRICEPALGSGAFLNEAINQLAKAYLDRRQEELHERIDPERYAVEEQKVKAYLALHRAYGVDLNATAVELAEVSLWLNVMYPGLRAPWFGLHLRRGNSLIGARRATYDLAALNRAKQSWLQTPPVERALVDGAIGDGEIHHFLLPAHGWGSVGGAKQAKELAPDQAAALRSWYVEIKKKPSTKDVARLRALAQRVERLWFLTQRRLEISEREVARDVDVWGADLAPVRSAVTREQVESALHAPGSPYRRLRWVMDAWCALWFWPLDGVEPPTMAQWLDGLEAVLGIDSAKAKGARGGEKQGLFADSTTFAELELADHTEIALFQMKPELTILGDHPWLGRVREIADREGFFHWELDFAQVFVRDGFDLQVGNPPWVRPDWNEPDSLAENDPFFGLNDPKSTSREMWRSRKLSILAGADGRSAYLRDLAESTGRSSFASSNTYFVMLAGSTSNLYRNFMLQVWRAASAGGVSGLIHPDDHFTHDGSTPLRSGTYRRLREHWGFINELQLFAEISHTDSYGLHIYGSEQEPNFLHAASLLDPDTLAGSLIHIGYGDVPGIQYPWGGWDVRPHLSRIISVDQQVLDAWATVLDNENVPRSSARMPRITSREQAEALVLIGKLRDRMSGRYLWSRCWDEDVIKNNGHAVWQTTRPSVLSDVVLQPPHFALSTPFSKEPNEESTGSSDYSRVDLDGIGEMFAPRTNYTLTGYRDRYLAEIRRWSGVPVTDFWRVAWRRRVGQNMERTLHAAIIPPGVAHVHTVHTCTVSTCATPVHTVTDGVSLTSDYPRATAIVAGLWSSLPYDYLVKLSGSDDVRPHMVDRFPAPLDHPAAPYLLLRTLRLNCLTRDYAPLWEELYELGFATDTWTAPFADWPNLGVTERHWTMETPLRTDYERRAALVEIDALAALMLGLSADHLALIFRAQFPVLRKYEYEMYFDNQGRKIAKDHHAQGVKQLKDDYKLLQAYLDGEPSGDLLDRYEPHPTDGFIRPDREAEMRAAHAEFTRRLGL